MIDVIDFADIPWNPAPGTKCEAEGCPNDAECQVPGGEDDEGVALLCWPCSHQNADHGTDLAETAGRTCDCPPEDIFPQHLIPRGRA